MLFKAILIFFPFLVVDFRVSGEVVNVTEIPGKVEVGELVKIHGAVSPTSNKFASINLQNGAELNKGDIGLHVSIRFKKKQIVFNTLEDGKWGEEKVETENFPIGDDGKFKITINVAETDFEISINDKNYKFPVRVSLDVLTHLLIENASVECIDWLKDGEDMCAPKSDDKAPPEPPTKGSSSPGVDVNLKLIPLVDAKVKANL